MAKMTLMFPYPFECYGFRRAIRIAIMPRATTEPSIHHVRESILAMIFFSHFMSVSTLVSLSRMSVIGSSSFLRLDKVVTLLLCSRGFL